MLTSEDLQICRELVEMGIAYEVLDENKNVVGFRLTQQGVQKSEEMFPDIALHESYYKWRMPSLKEK